MNANPVDWGSVAEAQAPRVWAAAREVAPDDDAAWDCVQEAFLTGLRSKQEPEGDPGRWLCGVARNHARHMTRSRRRWLDLLGRFSARARVRARSSERRASLTEALARLPARERDAVILRYLAGMTIAEVAASQRVSEAAAKSRVRRGLSRLRSVLGPLALVLLIVRAAAASPDPVTLLSGALATGGPAGIPLAAGALVLAAGGLLAPLLLESDPAAPPAEEPPPIVAEADPPPAPVGDGGPVAAPAGADPKQWVYFDSAETEHGPHLAVDLPGGGERKIDVEEDTVLISYLADNRFAVHPRLSISLGDTNRVLLRPSLEGIRKTDRAVLVLRMHKSGIPPTTPFEIAVHRITEAWSGAGTSWRKQPAFDANPTITVKVDPGAEIVRVDLTGLVRAWVGDALTNHGILLKIANPLPGAEPVRPARAATADPLEWIWFQSRETDRKPALSVAMRGGKTKSVDADADTILISYLDRPWGIHEQLGISRGDTTRVLIRFPLGGLKDVERAEAVLHLRQSPRPAGEPLEIALHRVTEPWTEPGTKWSNAPAFEKKPFLLAKVGPREGEVRLDLTETVRNWLSGKHANHGLLLKVARPVPASAPVPVRPRTPRRAWTQPEIGTGTPFSDTLPWAKEIEEAIARARDEKKLVLATVVPVGDRRWASGYAAAEKEWRGQTPHPWGDARAMAIDAGLVKERAMMASLFTDPEIAHLVKSHFVPVRLRLHTYYFDERGSKGLTDPLRQVGANALEMGGPALVFARPDGTLLHACRRMGVFSVPMVRAMLVAVLEKAGVEKIAPYPVKRDRVMQGAWRLAREGKLETARKALAAQRNPSPEASYLLAHLEDRLGKEERARELWQETVRRDPKGPWGSRSAIRLMTRQGRLEEWESLHVFPFDPLAERTEVDARELPIDDVLGRAVDYLLLVQRPDGSWRDPFVDVHPLSGPGSQYDKAVPRTGLVVDALIQARSRLPGRKKALDGAIARGIDYVGRFADDPRPHTWRLTYALHLQVAILGSDLPEGRKADARRRARRLVRALGEVQHDGGWSYMPPPRIHSFNTGPVLLLLTELPELGVPVPKEMSARAAAFLEGLRRKEEPAEFAYAANVRHKSLKASSCRTALCELALLEHTGGKDVSRLRTGVDLFFEHEASVRATTKVFESYFSPTAMHDSYHYYFGHYYVARALARLPRAEAKRFAARQREIVLQQVEVDGSFVDAQMQGKSYSTAMAVLTLLLGLEFE